jgi:hypothetical protein
MPDGSPHGEVDRFRTGGLANGYSTTPPPRPPTAASRRLVRRQSAAEMDLQAPSSPFRQRPPARGAGGLQAMCRPADQSGGVEDRAKPPPVCVQRRIRQPRRLSVNCRRRSSSSETWKRRRKLKGTRNDQETSGAAGWLCLDCGFIGQDKFCSRKDSRSPSQWCLCQTADAGRGRHRLRPPGCVKKACGFPRQGLPPPC